ncbi:hypothetical protein P171DRAFT_429213 [Karstenula rhodostoma CBS 690.94]|uniref:Uncharacterized protein n=1 Tax=Karstenula rhodostoma CBS 690.94 TaxID=1392251 RepID=A0A9P4PNR0_9PLEO|nr:hypothetical protein P171DRAFT_429213 [Karstenula rhodostoma CBS 690.94]
MLKIRIAVYQALESRNYFPPPVQGSKRLVTIQFCSRSFHVLIAKAHLDSGRMFVKPEFGKRSPTGFTPWRWMFWFKQSTGFETTQQKRMINSRRGIPAMQSIRTEL